MKPDFSLLMSTRYAVAELLAECPGCGAMSAQVIELAWRARAIECTVCKTLMPVDGEVLDALRAQPTMR